MVFLQPSKPNGKFANKSKFLRSIYFLIPHRCFIPPAFPVPVPSLHPGSIDLWGTSRGGVYLTSNYLTSGCWELSAPLLVEPPLELSLFHDSEKRPLVVERPGPDAPDATDESSRVENGCSLLNSLLSVHFFLDAIDVAKFSQDTQSGGQPRFNEEAVLESNRCHRWHLHSSPNHLLMLCLSSFVKASLFVQKDAT